VGRMLNCDTTPRDKNKNLCRPLNLPYTINDALNVPRMGQWSQTLDVGLFPIKDIAPFS